MTFITQKIIIAGPHGRMGQELIKAIYQADHLSLTGVINQLDSDPAPLGIDSNVSVSASDHILENGDCLIDFTTPSATMNFIKACCHYQCHLVIGTTGFDSQQQDAINEASKIIPIVQSPNMSPGVNVLFKLAQMAAELLTHTYDAEIIEAHHRLKQDAPSGTALHLGKLIAKTRHLSLKKHAVFGREGIIGKRKENEIGFSTIRAGSIIGDHTVLFADEGERLEITHRSASRSAYAKGAALAAEFLKNKPAGLYSMANVLGL